MAIALGRETIKKLAHYANLTGIANPNGAMTTFASSKNWVLAVKIQLNVRLNIAKMEGVKMIQRKPRLTDQMQRRQDCVYGPCILFQVQVQLIGLTL